MISIQDLQELIASGFLEGNTTIAGLIMFSAVLLLIFSLMRNIKAVLIISMPVSLIFSSLGILSVDFMILLIIVAVLGLATVARDTWRRWDGIDGFRG